VLDTIAADGLLDHVKRQGEKLRQGIEALQHPLVDHVRGAGLLIGIVLSEPLSAPVQQAAQDAGFLVNAAVPGTVRLAPPLIVGDAQTDAFLRALPGVLDRVQRDVLAAEERDGE
jgi:acetylornithine aminotransferase